MDYTVYVTATGEIAFTGISPNPSRQLTDPAHSLLAGQTGRAGAEYVSAGTLVPRPTMPVIVSPGAIVADGIDEAAIAGIPEGASLALNGIPMGIYTGPDPLVLTSDVPKQLWVLIQKFPYMDLEVLIDAS